jgi:putative ABC transport system permease protein
MKEGRSFSPAFPADTASDGIPGTTERITGGVVLNEKAIADLGIPEPAVGRLLESGRDNDTVSYLKIVGVTKDFHFASFKNAIKPFAFMLGNGYQDNVDIKVGDAAMDRTIAAVQKEWDRVAPGRPFHYTFLDDTFNKLYQDDLRFNQVVLYLTVLAIFIGCMGLFGLTAFMIERRTKEIGIRKVIGASSSSIVALLSRDFLRLVFMAMIIATPVAWIAMDQWLRNFAYRIHLQWWIFLAAGLLAVLIALATVSIQAVRAALSNPVRSLRAE